MPLRQNNLNQSPLPRGDTGCGVVSVTALVSPVFQSADCGLRTQAMRAEQLGLASGEGLTYSQRRIHGHRVQGAVPAGSGRARSGAHVPVGERGSGIWWSALLWPLLPHRSAGPCLRTLRLASTVPAPVAVSGDWRAGPVCLLTCLSR